MAGVRSQVSLLLANGHSRASSYPVWMVAAEAKIVTNRINAQLATHISLMQMVLSSIPNMSVKPAATRKSAKELAVKLREMVDGKS
jgi:hypothetical protein